MMTGLSGGKIGAYSYGLNSVPTDPAEQPLATTRRLLCMRQSLSVYDKG